MPLVSRLQILNLFQCYYGSASAECEESGDLVLAIAEAGTVTMLALHKRFRRSYTKRIQRQSVPSDSLNDSTKH